MEVQLKIEKLRADCENSDAQINACQHHLKKCELLLVCHFSHSVHSFSALPCFIPDRN